MFKDLFRRKPEPAPLADPVIEWQALSERTRRRQLEAKAKLIREGKHVLCGYRPPKDTNLRETFARVRQELAQQQKQ